MDINISINNNNSDKVQDFEKKEGIISDIEHYGSSDIDFKKKEI